MSGLTDAEIFDIFGYGRLNLYRDGTQLIDMVEIIDDPKWGPTTRIRPLKDFGPGAAPRTRPKPGPAPKPPRNPRTPKPQAPEAPKIEETLKRNRDPQWLLEEFRKIAPNRSKLNEILDRMNPHLEKLAEAKSILIQNPNDQTANFNFIEASDALESLNKEYQRESKVATTEKQKQKMRELLRSSNPISVSVKEMTNPRQMNPDREEYILSDHQKRRLQDVLEEVTSYVDDRKLDIAVWIQGDEPHLSREERLESDGEVHARDVRFVGTKLQDTLGFYVPLRGLRKQIGINFEVADDTDDGNGNRFSIGKLSSTVAHEFMHWVDDRNPMRVAAYRDFYKRRTIGDPVLRSMYGGKYRPDRWPDPYCGKTEIADRDGHELNTRGIQFILDDPIGFAELDFDYFSYVVKNVLGAQE